MSPEDLRRTESAKTKVERIASADANEQRRLLQEDLEESLSRKESGIESIQKRAKLLRETIENSFTDEQKDTLVASLDAAHSRVLDDMYSRGQIDISDQLAQKHLPYGMSTTVKRRTALGVMIGGSVVGAIAVWKGLKWLLGAAKKKAVAATHAAGGFLKKAALISGIGLGLDFFFFKGALRRTLFAGAQAMAGEVKDKAVDLKDKTVEKAKGIADVAKEGIGKASERSTEIATSPEAKEQIKKGEEVLSMSLAIKGLGIQYDVMRDISPDFDSPKPFLPDAKEILNLAAHKKMGLFIACMEAGRNDDKPYHELLKEIYPKTYNSKTDDKKIELIIAAKLITGYLKKYRKILERSAKLQGKSLHTMELQEALNVFVHAEGASIDMVEALSNAVLNNIALGKIPEDPMPIIKKVFENRKLFGERVIELALEPLSKHASAQSITPEDRNKLREECARVAGFFVLSENVRVSAVRDRMPEEWPEDGNERVITLALCESIKSREMINRLIGSLLISEDIPKRNKEEKEIVLAINTIFRSGNLKLKDAFQLYVLLQNDQLSNTIILFRTIKLLKEYGYPDLATNRYAFITNKIAKAAGEGIGSIKELAEKLDITEEQAREIENLGRAAEEKTQNWVERWLANIWIFAKMFPKTAIALGLVVGGPILWKGSKLTLGVRSKFHWTQIRMLAAKTDEDMNKFAEEHGISESEAIGARDSAKKVVEDMNTKVGFRLPFWKWRLRRKGKRAVGRVKKMKKGKGGNEIESESDTATVAESEAATAETKGKSTYVRAFDGHVYEMTPDGLKRIHITGDGDIEEDSGLDSEQESAVPPNDADAENKTEQDTAATKEATEAKARETKRIEQEEQNKIEASERAYENARNRVDALLKSKERAEEDSSNASYNRFLSEADMVRNHVQSFEPDIGQPKTSALVSEIDGMETVINKRKAELEAAELDTESQVETVVDGGQAALAGELDRLNPEGESAAAGDAKRTIEGGRAGIETETETDSNATGTVKVKPRRRGGLGYKG